MIASVRTCAARIADRMTTILIGRRWYRGGDLGRCGHLPRTVRGHLPGTRDARHPQQAVGYSADHRGRCGHLPRTVRGHLPRTVRGHLPGTNQTYPSCRAYIGQQVIAGIVIGGMVLAGCLFPAGSVAAQAPLPPPSVDERERDESREDKEREELARLSREAKELGREYLELLNELKDVMKDYNRYLAEAAIKRRAEARNQAGETSIDEIAAEQKEFQQLMEKLAAGAYLQNAAQLETDLARTRAELQAQREQLKANRKAYALAANLQRSLEAINIQLESELSGLNFAEEGLPKELAIYFRRASQEGQVDPEKLQQVYIRLFDQGEKFQVTVPDFDFTFDFDVSDLARLEKLDSIFGDSMVFMVPNAHPPRSSRAKPPKPPKSIVVGGRDIVFTGAGGETEVVKGYSDSIRVSSRQALITVTNPNGEMHLTAWDRDMILVRAEIVLGADSKQSAEALAERVKLQLERSGDGYLVGYAMPELTDTREKVANRMLRVMVPQGNPITLTSPFGEVDLRDLQNDLTVTAQHAEVVGREIVGDMMITCEMGAIELADIEGDIKIVARHTPVELSDCEGDIEISNEFAPVELADCEGNATIRNSGGVKVTYHDGDVTVENSNGQVFVEHSEGNYQLTNQHQLMQVAYIEGSVMAANSHAPLMISDITGRIKADNVYAPIEAKYFSGPIDLTNSNGPIIVNLTGKQTGPSVIQATGGLINLTLQPDIDLLVRATAVEGMIESTFPITVRDGGTTKTAELSLGKGTPELTVTGTRTRILLVEED